MYQIHVTPSTRYYQPHIWGTLETKELAESYAKQLRKIRLDWDLRKRFYSKVKVVKVKTVKPEATA